MLSIVFGGNPPEFMEELGNKVALFQVALLGPYESNERGETAGAHAEMWDAARNDARERVRRMAS